MPGGRVTEARDGVAELSSGVGERVHQLSTVAVTRDELAVDLDVSDSMAGWRPLSR